MELEIYDAFRSAGINDDKAKAAVESINKVIDSRYSLHAAQLATRGDLAELKGEMKGEFASVRREMAEKHASTLTWIMGTLVACTGIIVACMKAFTS